MWGCESCQYHHFLARKLLLIPSGGWYESCAGHLQDGITVYCPIAKHLSKMVGGCWAERVMNTSLFMGRGAQKTACWPWMAGYTLHWCEWTWTPSVTCQLLSHWSVCPKLCSQRREACSRYVLVQWQRPQAFLVLQILQHKVLQTGKISLPDILSTTEGKRLAWWWAPWEPGHRQQQEQWHGGMEHTVTVSTVHASELHGECMGLTSARNGHGCQRVQRRCCTQCSTEVPEVLKSPNTDYYILTWPSKYLSRIQCCHHKR